MAGFAICSLKAAWKFQAATHETLQINAPKNVRILDCN